MEVRIKHRGLSDEAERIILNHQKTPPVLLGKLAQDLGLIVKRATLPTGISGEIKSSDEARSGYMIRVNRHESKARQRFTVAHEIAHFLLHKEYIGDGIKDSVLYRSSLSDTIEREANRFAAQIIMPWHLIQKKIDEYGGVKTEQDVEQIASDFKVSSTAMGIRLGVVE